MSATEPVSGKQKADCGKEEGYTGQGLFNKHVENLEQVNVCFGGEPKNNITSGSSGGPVYKWGQAYGIITNSGGCTVLYEGISSAQGVLHVEVLRALS